MRTLRKFRFNVKAECLLFSRGSRKKNNHTMSPTAGASHTRSTECGEFANPVPNQSVSLVNKKGEGRGQEGGKDGEVRGYSK